MKRLALISLLLFGNWATAQSIGALEYFIDGPDPGIGNATALTLDTNSGELTQLFSISTAGLGEGFHSLYVRSQIQNGNWGLYDRTVFYITSVSDVSQNIVSVEYFFDVDPGVGNGTEIALNANTGSLTQSLIIPTTNLTDGIHSFYIRTKNTDGNWSLYDRTIIYVNTPANKDEPIEAAEYFYDGADPGVGNATALTVNENTGRLIQSFTLPTGGLTIGDHTLYIRARQNSTWSLYDSANFTVDTMSIDNTVTINEKLITANFEATGATYQWLDCSTENTVIPGENEKSFTAVRSGEYAVQITFNGQTVISTCSAVEVQSGDDDNDGIINADDICPNTPEGTLVDFDGCPIFTLPANNFALQTTGESCNTKNDGSLIITAVESLTYTVTLSGGTNPISEQFTDTITLSDLEAGQYQICITVENEPGYEICFDVNISEPEPLSVSSKVNITDKTISLELRGSITYNITVNDRFYRTNENTITLPLEKVENSISVFGDKGCQGSFEEMIVLNESSYAYPNPIVTEKLTVYLGSQDEFEKVSATLFTLSGMKVMNADLVVQNGHVAIEITNIPNGVYLLTIQNKTTLFNHKIIKQ